MGAVLFYQITRSPVEETARTILGRALGQGWRVVVRGTDAAGLARLDASLWRGPAEDFLPHGLAGGPHDADQPVLMTDRPGRANGAQAVMLVDGAAVDAAEVGQVERVWLLFEGANDTALEAARAQWRSVTAAGLVAQYWSEESGKWEKKAESGGG
jgi:DNA polymerase III subunit chi